MKNLFGLLILAALPAMGATATVHIQGIQFVPQHMQIHSGDTVQFINDSSFPHTVTGDPSLASDPQDVQLPSGAEPFHSDILAKGGSYSHTFTTVGTYQYVCLKHEAMGMTGSIEVVAAE